MKTRPQTWMVSSLTAALLLAATGCESQQSADLAGGEASAKSTNTIGAVLAGTNAAPAVATSEPAVLRSERVALPLSPEVARVVELVESGVGEEVVRAYVGTATEPFDLTLDEVLYLRDIGVSDGVIASMMRRGGALREAEEESAQRKEELAEAVEEIKDAIAAAPAPAESMAPPPAPVEGGTATEPIAVAAVQAPPEAPVVVQQFYSDLAPYGSWYQVPSYGWVWQPSVVVVNSGWAPYRHGGRWAWSDHGWYWCSDYSWGWAPFHYGRWATYPGLGWCWVPGSVWGPSWVTWRSHGSYVGWAPLPPACGWSTGVGLTWYGGGVSVGFGFGLSSSYYTYVPYGNFCHRGVSRYALPAQQVKAIHGDATVINNIIVGDNNTIVNNGIGYDKVRSAVRGEIPKARVEPLPAQADRTVRVDRLERAKDGYVVYQPTPVESRGGRPPALRTQAGPTPEAAMTPANRMVSASAAGLAARPSAGSRFADGSGTTGKMIESRGASVDSRPVRSSPTAVNTWSPGPQTRSSLVGRQPGRSVATTPGSYETRSPSPAPGNPSRVVRTENYPTSRTPGAVYGPSRQTTPVPLGDPSRNLPARVREPAPRTYAPSAPVSKTAIESRTAAPQVFSPPSPRSVYERPGLSPSRSPVTPPSLNVPSRAPMAAPPTMSVPRAPVSVPAPAMNVPRSSFSPPSRPSFSAPAPSAPRPSFSAPAPTMSAPRAPVSAPAAAPSRPSSGGSGSRNQVN